MTWGNSTRLEQKQNWHSLWHTGHCPVPRLEPSVNWPLSGFLSVRSLKFIGLFGETTDQWSTSSNGPLRDCVRSL
jgi:hypothetical protein